MVKITLVCVQCGGQCEFDENRETGFCTHCGTKILIKSDIVQNTYNTTQHITKNIIGVEGKEIDELLADGNKLLSIDQIDKAAKKFEKAVNIDPLNLHAWIGLGESGNTSDMNNGVAYNTALKIAEDSGNPQNIDIVRKSIRNYNWQNNNVCNKIAPMYGLDALCRLRPHDQEFRKLYKQNCLETGKFCGEYLHIFPDDIQIQLTPMQTKINEIVKNGKPLSGRPALLLSFAEHYISALKSGNKQKEMALQNLFERNNKDFFLFKNFKAFKKQYLH